jgi:hypothetical protein
MFTSRLRPIGVAIDHLDGSSICVVGTDEPECLDAALSNATIACIAVAPVQQAGTDLNLVKSTSMSETKHAKFSVNAKAKAATLIPLSQVGLDMVCLSESAVAGAAIDEGSRWQGRDRSHNSKRHFPMVRVARRFCSNGVGRAASPAPCAAMATRHH